VSRADGQRHYELFAGKSADHGQHWTFAPLTHDSSMDNIRPVVARGDGKRVVMWLRGKMTTFKNYDLDVVGVVQNP
jgi:hypothetical protein